MLKPTRTALATASFFAANIISHPANAAGFLDKSLANFAKIDGLPDGLKSMIKTIAATSYLIPPLVFLGCVVAIMMTSQHSEGAAAKAKIATVIIFIGMAILFLYDTYLVGTV